MIYKGFKVVSEAGKVFIYDNNHIEEVVASYQEAKAYIDMHCDESNILGKVKRFAIAVRESSGTKEEVTRIARRYYNGDVDIFDVFVNLALSIIDLNGAYDSAMIEATASKIISIINHHE